MSSSPIVVTREELLAIVRDAILEASQYQWDTPPMTAEEQEWVRDAMKIQAQRLAFRKAVIEKTTVALVWAAIVISSTFAWQVFREWLVAHGYKP